MANKRIQHRQYPLKASTPVMGIANIGAGNGYEIAIPPNGYVTEVYADTLTAFDGTTNTITVGDGTTTFVNAQDTKTPGRETAAVTSKFYPNGGVITVSMAQTGAATTGSAIVVVEYVISGRVNEVQQ